MRVLITGVSGFVGTYLSNKLLEDGYEVIGISRSKPLNREIRYTSCDINDSATIEAVLKATKPDEIYHLAGTGFIPQSYHNPMNVYNTIFNGTLNLYESLRKLDLDAKVLYVSSADVYGEGTGKAFNETDEIRPSNPYAGAKACAELASQQYNESYQIRIIRARPFNHTGPKQSSNFVCSNFARQIAEMEIKGKSKIDVGNLKVKRDFLDVRDVVSAYYKLMKQGRVGHVYNVSSNISVSISEVLDYLFLYSEIKSPNIRVDMEKVRANDASVRFGDNFKLSSDTGWLPQYDLRDTMRELLDYWRNELTSS